MEKGTAAPGIIVAEMLRRNRKMTITTTQTVSSSVSSTSRIELRMDRDVSKSTASRMEGGSSRWNCGSSRRMLSTTSTVLVPGCRLTARITPRTSFIQAISLSFSTLSITLPSCASRTGVPFRHATMMGR